MGKAPDPGTPEASSSAARQARRRGSGDWNGQRASVKALAVAKARHGKLQSSRVARGDGARASDWTAGLYWFIDHSTDARLLMVAPNHRHVAASSAGLRLEFARSSRRRRRHVHLSIKAALACFAPSSPPHFDRAFADMSVVYYDTKVTEPPDYRRVALRMTAPKGGSGTGCTRLRVDRQGAPDASAVYSPTSVSRLRRTRAPFCGRYRYRRASIERTARAIRRSSASPRDHPGAEVDMDDERRSRDGSDHALRRGASRGS